MNYLIKMVKKIINKTRLAFNKLTFKPYSTRKTVEGISFDFYIGDWLGQEWYDNMTEWLEMRFMKDNIVKKGDVVFECGGHHGCSAILLSNWVGREGKIVTFEPVQKNIEIINRNIKINNIDNIIAKHNAVGDTEGKIVVSDFSCATVTSKRSGGVEVDLVPLDNFVELKPTLLKIDVEGFEVQVLKGARKILESLPKLAIEIHTDLLVNYGTSVSELFSIININNYECWVQWEDGDLPEKYDGIREITKRVHLFAIPKLRSSDFPEL